MKLSSVDMVAEYRATLKALRTARNALGTGSHGKLNCKIWVMGTEYDFCDLIGRARLKGEIATMLTHEINEVVRSLEAHGVVVDE